MRPDLCNGTVYVHLSVCPSACPIYRPLQQRLAGCCCGPGGQAISGAAAARRIAARRSAANASSVTLSADVGSEGRKLRETGQPRFTQQVYTAQACYFFKLRVAVSRLESLWLTPLNRNIVAVSVAEYEHFSTDRLVHSGITVGDKSPLHAMSHTCLYCPTAEHHRTLVVGRYPRPVWARERCRISPPGFLAECCKRQLNQGSFVLLYFRLFTFSDLY